MAFSLMEIIRQHSQVESHQQNRLGTFGKDFHDHDIIMISSGYHQDIISCSSVKSLKHLLRYQEVVNDIDAWEPKVQF